jgi:hypothetical protein
LNNGANIHARDRQARDVLQAAVVVKGSEEIVELLLRNGAIVNAYCASSMYGYAIEAAAHYGARKWYGRQRGHKEVAKLLQAASARA